MTKEPMAKKPIKEQKECKHDFKLVSRTFVQGKIKDTLKCVLCGEIKVK